ncbi:MAG: Uma2 family endonuclease [Gemmataceae bacterium]|nr:Uma2 family endonuclease [Gemmataceae bacterium]
MPAATRTRSDAEYDAVERRAFANQRLEDLVESTVQGEQRSITLQSMAYVRTRSPRVQCFTDLLIISFPKGSEKAVEIAPDNMIVLSDKPVGAFGSFRLEKQPVAPYCVIEYVSKRSAKKDFEESFAKYERLRMPYYLIFHPDNEEITLFRYDKRKKLFVSVPPNDEDRYPLPEAELEAGILDGWMRYWFRGELVPLVPDLKAQTAKAEERAGKAEERAGKAEERAAAAEAENQRLRRQLGLD